MSRADFSIGCMGLKLQASLPWMQAAAAITQTHSTSLHFQAVSTNHARLASSHVEIWHRFRSAIRSTLAVPSRTVRTSGLEPHSLALLCYPRCAYFMPFLPFCIRSRYSRHQGCPRSRQVLEFLTTSMMILVAAKTSVVLNVGTSLESKGSRRTMGLLSPRVCISALSRIYASVSEGALSSSIQQTCPHFEERDTEHGA